LEEQRIVEASLLSQLKEIVELKVPLNRILGIELESLDATGARLRVEMKEVLVGNFALGILHGGIISCILDVTGSVTGYTVPLRGVIGRPLDEVMGAIAKVGTIDLRIDFLRPGKGTYFVSRGGILRSGKRLATIRTELEDDRGRVVAVGTGTYTVG
jgi:uncharacterized protein (TIGR00369 family)